jgi:hypothetical protein
MGVSLRVNISLGAADGPGRAVQDRNSLGKLDLNEPRIARPLNQKRKPADLELQADMKQQPRLVYQTHVARLRLHIVRVLESFGYAFHLYPLPAHRFGNGGEIGCGGHDEERLRRPQCRGKEKNQQEAQYYFHNHCHDSS